MVQSTGDAAGFDSGHDGDSQRLADSPQSGGALVKPIWVWGVPFSPLSMAETVSAIGGLIERRRPAFFITANVHYAMLTDANADLRAINDRAAFILADGMPLVWAARWRGSPLPERVAGSDLIFELSAEAARKGYRLFLLGGAEGVAANAARILCERFPGLVVAGIENMPFRDLSADEQAAVAARIRASRPDLLLAAFTMPRGERWLAANLHSFGALVAVNVGAAIDFAAGRISRAPRWMQKSGLEWAFRLGLEPRRLFARYSRNALFIACMVARDVRQAISRRRTTH
jgi:N-acetylglucosaminyldiphosphoundecaprenol N-acetyl-beta-D-mannosaminyltransferase